MTDIQWIRLAQEACELSYIPVPPSGSIRIIATWEQTFTDSPKFRHNAVFRLGGQGMLKLYGTDGELHLNIEHAALHTLRGVVPVPEPLAHGKLCGGIPYQIMGEIRGRTLQEEWAALTRSELLDAAAEIGQLTQAWHGARTDGLCAVEAHFGNRARTIREKKEERIAEIVGMEWLASSHRDELLGFLESGTAGFLSGDKALTHSDLSHAHIYLDRTKGRPCVSGVIDWAEAMTGPAEWDLAFHWLWTFSQDREAMKECLRGYYAEESPPDRLALQCFAAHLFTFSMREAWDYYTYRIPPSEPIVPSLVQALFPPEVFGDLS